MYVRLGIRTVRMRVFCMCFLHILRYVRMRQALLRIRITSLDPL